MFKKLFPVLLLPFLFANAQEIKFGKISMDELKETVYEKDSSASAAYLYKSRKSYYQYTNTITLMTEVHERIKIYDKAGLDQATKIVNLYKGSGGSNESITGLKGFTFNLENGKIIETKLSKDGVFKSEYSSSLNQTKFTLPEVKEGSVIEYKYKISSPFVQNIDEFVFQEDIPIKKLLASMSIYGFFSFGMVQKGSIMLKPKKEVLNDLKLDTRVVKNTFTLKDVPAIKDEPYVSNLDNYRSGIKFEIKSLDIPGSIHESYSNSWGDVAKTIYKSSSFGKQLDMTGYYEEELKAYLGEVTTDKEKMEKTLEFVKSKVKWNEKRRVYSSTGVKKAYKTGSGNSADINLMLVSMLKNNGLKAYPVVISTRDNGIPLFPTLDGFNYVIAAVKKDNEFVLLDGTEKYGTLNVLPIRDLNWYGRLITEDGNSTSIDLMPTKSSLEFIIMNVTLSDEGSIEGKCREQYTNHNAMIMRGNYYKTNEDAFLEELEKQRNGVEVSDFSIKNGLDVSKPIMETYGFFKEDAAEIIADKIYFSPLFHLAKSENPFKLEKREYPVDFGYPWEDKYNINIEIPEGYAIESIPEPVSMVLPENLGAFKYNIVASDNLVRVVTSVRINAPVISTLAYASLKEFYKQMVDKHTERVVLKKI